MVALSPSQEKVIRVLSEAQRDHRLLLLWCRDGLGRTTMLEALRAQWGGLLLGADEVLSRLAGSHPLAMEEALFSVVSEALEKSSTVFLDDLHLVLHVVHGGCHFYPRTGLIEEV